MPANPLEFVTAPYLQVSLPPTPVSIQVTGATWHSDCRASGLWNPTGCSAARQSNHSSPSLQVKGEGRKTILLYHILPCLSRGTGNSLISLHRTDLTKQKEET